MDLKLSKQDKDHLKALDVAALYLFGSRAQGIAGPLSDYDFAVLMKKPGDKRGGKVYDQLYEILFPLCRPRTLQNDVIDIIFLRDAPLELRFHVIRYGQVLFDAQPLRRLRFEVETQLLYSDYRPILDMFDNAILATI